MRTWKFVGCVAAAALLLAPTTADALDENRQGFLIGFGVGSGLTRFSQDLSLAGFNYPSAGTENKFVVATDFKIGWGITDRLTVYYINQITWFKHDDVFVFDNPDNNFKDFIWIFNGFSAPAQSVWIANGFGGIGATYYLNPGETSYYVMGAAGFSAWTAPFESDDWLTPVLDHSRTWFGSGFLGGVGWEFLRHWSLEATVVWGNPSQSGDFGLNVDTSSLSLLVLLTGLAY